MKAAWMLASGLVAAAAAAAVGQDTPRVAPTDTITWIENDARRTRSGAVESAGWDKVVVAQGGQRTTYDGADVVDIRWGDVPRSFDAATAALDAGDADAALAGFDATLAARATQRGWLVEHGSLGLGEALLALSFRDPKNADKAAHAFATARDANPRSLVLDRILGGLAKAELVRGRVDEALAAAQDLETAGRAARRPAWEIDALVLRARSLDARRDIGGALRAVDAALALAEQRGASTKDVDLAQRLRRSTLRAATRRLWLLVADAEESKSPEAAARARKSADEAAAKWTDDADVQAASSNAAGAMLLLSGDAKKALRKFQETEVVRFDVVDEAARALWYESVCHEKLGDATARAEDLRRLAESYPDTEWARRVR